MTLEIRWPSVVTLTPLSALPGRMQSSIDNMQLPPWTLLSEVMVEKRLMGLCPIQVLTTVVTLLGESRPRPLMRINCLDVLTNSMSLLPPDPSSMTT